MVHLVPAMEVNIGHPFTIDFQFFLEINCKGAGWRDGPTFQFMLAGMLENGLVEYNDWAYDNTSPNPSGTLRGRVSGILKKVDIAAGTYFGQLELSIAPNGAEKIQVNVQTAMQFAGTFESIDLSKISLI